MGIASMVIGIISLIVGFFPICGTWAVIPAIVGIGLGIGDLVVRAKRNESKGMAIAGLILNPLAILIVIIWWMGIAMAAKDSANALDTDFQQQMIQSMQNFKGFQGQQHAPPSVPIQPGPHHPGTPDMQPMQPMDPVPAETDPAPSPKTPPSPE
jgi:hypothetical protein